MAETTDAVSDLVDLLDVLNADLLRAYEAMRASPGQYERRAFIRALFAAVEAATFLMKQQCLTRIDRSPCLYGFEEVALLREETYGLDSRCQVTTQPKFLPTDINFRFALNLFMRASVKDFRLEVGDGGWDSFKRAAQIRHRITHPKGRSLIDVSDDELRAVLRAHDWFAVTITASMMKAAEVNEGEATILKERLEKLMQQAGRRALQPEPMPPT